MTQKLIETYHSSACIKSYRTSNYNDDSLPELPLHGTNRSRAIRHHDVTIVEKSTRKSKCRRNSFSDDDDVYYHKEKRSFHQHLIINRNRSIRHCRIIPDTCKVSINDRITKVLKRKGYRKLSFSGYCTRLFLQNRHIQMENSSVNKNTDFNVALTLEKILDIRKKRLAHKYGRKYCEDPYKNKNYMSTISGESVPNTENTESEVETDNGSVICIDSECESLVPNKCKENDSIKFASSIKKGSALSIVPENNKKSSNNEDISDSHRQLAVNTSGAQVCDPSNAAYQNIIIIDDCTLDVNKNVSNKKRKIKSSSTIVISDSEDDNRKNSKNLDDKNLKTFSPLEETCQNLCSVDNNVSSNDSNQLDAIQHNQSGSQHVESGILTNEKEIVVLQQNEVVLPVDNQNLIHNSSINLHTETKSNANDQCSEYSTTFTQHINPNICQSCSLVTNIDAITDNSLVPSNLANNSSELQSLVCDDYSNNRLGSNIYHTKPVKRRGLREIIIDGSNVALSHTNGLAFSVEGLQIAIKYFVKRGHKVTAFVPTYRLKYGQCTNHKLLRYLADLKYVIFTPSREVRGRRITPYDDRYIIQYATACEGIVVSNDQYRDLLHENRLWKETIERRLLMPTWVGDTLMFPEDPLGRDGPKLSRFLSFP